jgi:hypothetical protein
VVFGPDAVVYGNSEIPTVAWHHGKGWALLEYSWDEEVVMSKITAELPTLEAAARQVLKPIPPTARPSARRVIR